MHATIEQLLSLRDGEPVSAIVKQHVNVCMLCHERLEELTLVQDELNRLPVYTPPHDSWPGILARVELKKQKTNQLKKLVRYSGFGLAASALLATFLFIYSSIDQIRDINSIHNPLLTTENNKSDSQGIISSENVMSDETTNQIVTISEPSLDELITRSAYLEAVLHAMPRRPKITRASTANLITGLQDGVALIDYQLNFSADDQPTGQSRQLWQQRVDFMNSLVNVRYAETQRVAYIPN